MSRTVHLLITSTKVRTQSSLGRSWWQEIRLALDGEEPCMPCWEGCLAGILFGSQKEVWGGAWTDPISRGTGTEDSGLRIWPSLELHAGDDGSVHVTREDAEQRRQADVKEAGKETPDTEGESGRETEWNHRTWGKSMSRRRFGRVKISMVVKFNC